MKDKTLMAAVLGLIALFVMWVAVGCKAINDNPRGDDQHSYPDEGPVSTDTGCWYAKLPAHQMIIPLMSGNPDDGLVACWVDSSEGKQVVCSKLKPGSAVLCDPPQR